MPEVPAQGAYSAPPAEEGGIKGALNKQLGPLKAWQWGLAVGGAVLVFKWFGRGATSGGSSSGDTTNANVPSSDYGGGGTNGGFQTLPTNYSTVTRTILGKLLYYKTTLTQRTPIYNSKGKIVGYYSAGKTLVFASKVKIGKAWYYKVLNTNQYVKAYFVDKTSKVSPIYSAPVVESVTVPISSQIAAPVTTSASNPTPTAQSSYAALTTTVDNATQISSPVIGQ